MLLFFKMFFFLLLHLCYKKILLFLSEFFALVSIMSKIKTRKHS